MQKLCVLYCETAWHEEIKHVVHKHKKCMYEDTKIILLIFYWHIHSFYNSNSSKLWSSVMTVGFWEFWNNFSCL